MSRFLVFLSALAIGYAYFQRGESGAGAIATPAARANEKPVERVVIDGKLYPKNPKGIYQVDGITTFHKDDSKLAAAEKAAAEAVRGPKPGEVIINPSTLDHRIDQGN